MATFAESAVAYSTKQLLQANKELATAQAVLTAAIASGQVVVGEGEYFTLKNKVNSSNSFVETVQIQLDKDNAALGAERAPPPPPLPQPAAVRPTSDTAANKIANDPPVNLPVVALQETVSPPAPPAENDILSESEGKNLKANLAGTGAASNYEIAPSSSTASEVAHTEETTVQPPEKLHLAPLPNPLHAYPGYTYGLSLALLTVDEYNRIIKNQDYTANRVIIASAGRHNNNEGPTRFKRAEPIFSEDFYFDNLNMTTVIGMNEHSRSSNAINFTFTIVEPYGVTLLTRIIDLSSSPEVKSMNYLDQPYLLQIDFFASNDAGEIVGIVPDQTKRIPIRILKMDIKASGRGSEYQLQASAYGHSAFDLSTVSTPANFEITAGTVAGFFQSSDPELAFSVLAADREAKIGVNGQFQQASNGTLTVRGGTGEIAPLLFVGSGSAADTNAISAEPIYKIKSYGGAINAYYADLAATNKIQAADTFSFRFHDDIKNAKFNISSETLSASSTPMASEDNRMSIRGAAETSLEYTARIFAINAGTSIDQVIMFVMRHSDYLQGQLKLSTDFTGPNAAEEYADYKKQQKSLPLKWFKVIPTVTLGEYCKSQQRWARNITYNVIPYTIYNTKLSIAPQAVVTDAVKVHNYYYTGANSDVLDFSIEFNALYYTAITAYTENVSKLYNINPAENLKTNNPDNYVVSDIDANSVMPIKSKPVVFNARENTTGGAITNAAVAVTDVEASIYTAAGGDMLACKLKIIGDPQYIKQDDIFYPPNLVADSDQVDGTGIDTRLIANGSLHMDKGEVYIQITVRSPVDIDETTGMMKFDPHYTENLFSGMYRVLQVESTFSNGQFIQIIDAVRLPRQMAFDYTETPKKASTERITAVGSIAVIDNNNIVPNMAAVNNVAGEDTAPGSNPVQDSPPPTQTNEEKDLARVKDTAPETAITAQTEPVATPSPVPPSGAKLALQERADQARAARDQAQRAANSVSDSIVELAAQIEQIQANIDRLPGRVARGVLTQAEADPLIAQGQSSLASKNNLLSEKQREFAPLDAANKTAQTAYVNALDAYSRAA
jgi:hypothetical protein